MTSNRLERLAGTVALLAIVVTSFGVTAQAAGGPRAPRAAASSVDWPQFGNNSDNQRFSPLTQITPANVKKLGVAWTYTQGPNLITWETDPIVVNGVMYLTTNADQVVALNAATGKLIWEYTPQVNFYLSTRGGGGGYPVNRGVTVANGKVYLLTYDAKLQALSQATGEKLWSTQIADPSKGNLETSQPTVWKNMVFTGSGESDNGARGFVDAYDANTGKRLWRWWAVPPRGQGWVPAKGYHGGGGVWMAPTIDTTTGILYAATGNPSPDFVNSVRPGCNPWTDSVVALQATTGKFLWGREEVCNDTWDYDSHSPPTLFNVTIHGKTVRAVGNASKEGHYWILDARTGKPLFAPVPVAKINHPHVTQKGVVVCPGFFGGSEYSPHAFSPLTHAIYVDAMNVCMKETAAPVKDVMNHQEGAVDIGGPFSFVGKQSGVMTAIDVNTGKILWQDQMPKPMCCGSAVTAGGLVFSGSGDGNFYAFDARTGKILWKGFTNLDYGAAPIVYGVGGTEYVAIAAGGWGGTTLANTGNPGDTFYVFKLNGKKIVPAPSAVKATTQGGKPPAGAKKIDKWIAVTPENKTVYIHLESGVDPSNSGFNFNGYYHGKATFIVPVGWNVIVDYVNKAALAHSAVITPNTTPEKIGALAGGLTSGFRLAFPSSSTPMPIKGIANGEQVFAFTASNPGKFYLLCGVPGHFESGMWDWFVVSGTAAMPSLQVSK